MQKRNPRGPHGDTPPVLRTPLMPSPLNTSSSRGLSLSSSNIPKTRSQLSGLAGLMACSVFAIVALSILHGYRAENTYASTHAFSHHYETNPRYLANRYEVQPRQSFRQASSVSELDELRLVSRESNSSSIQSRLDAPCPHRSQVFPRAQDEPVDSVVVVSFDVFRTPRASGAVDPAESELEGIVRDIVASSTFNETEKRQMVRNAALWFVGRAMLSRPSGFDQPKRQANSGATQTDVVMSEYVSFFIGRNTSAWTYATSSHDAATRIPPISPLCTRPTVQERYPIGVPVTMDVVYTHVADDARSQREFRKRFPQAFRGSVQRFRDWNELKFSTRSVFHYSICDDPKSLCYFEDDHGMHPNAVVRNIYIVVADTDQVPAYINTSHPRVHIVEHKTLFGMSDEEHSLPTFNSHAIESVLHRIPGLSRFYVYFNNDMLWGRQLSFFDYFRPLAEARFGMRYSLLEAQLADKGAQCAHPAIGDAELRDFMDNDGVVDLRRLRVTMMFEPLMHFENTENGKDMKFERKRYVDPSATTAAPPSGSKRSLRHEPLFPSAKKNNTTNTTASSPPTETSPQQPEISASMYRVRNCSAHGVERMEDLQFHDFAALFLLSNGRRASVISERFRTFVSNNKNYALEVFGVAGWHSHSYSHSPHLYDRDIMTAMLEKDFFRAARATRKSQLRHGSNLWTTMVANSYHTMHRKVLDWELMDGKRVALLWEGTAGALTIVLNGGGGGGRHQHHRNRGVSLEEESPTSNAKYIAVPLLASTNVRDDIRSASYNISVDDILSPYWKDARNNAEFGVESHRYSHTMWRAIEYLLMIAAASGDKRNQALKHFHAEAVEPQFRALLDDASGISQEKLCSHFLGRDADENAVLPLLIAPPRVFVRRGGNNKNARETHGGLRSYAIAEDCNRALQKKAHWSITELEKLDHHIVKLDQKAGMYHFCMMNTLRATKRYTEELSRETKLFVAANDDFPVRLPGGTEESVRNLLSTASGSVPAAGWEVWWKHYDEI